MTSSPLMQSAIAIGAALTMNAVRRAVATLAGYLAVGILLTASLVFLTLSAYHAITLAIGEIYASLIVGSAYLVASLIALLVLSFRSR